MKKLTFLLLIVLLISSCENKQTGEITVVSTEEMQSILDLQEVQLLDVRTQDEYNKGHLTNSQNIDFNSPTFDKDIAGLNKDKPVILYCQKGGRSAKCAEKMQLAGFKKIYDLEGGFSKWQFKVLQLNLKS